MPRGMHKSGRFIKRVRTTPAGNVSRTYVARKPAFASCIICKRPLPGTPRLSGKALKQVPKSKKRPQRPFGGVMCSPCTRQEIKNRARK